MVDMQVNWLFNALLFYVPDTYQNTYVEMYHCARLSVNKVTYGRSPIIHEGVVKCTKFVSYLVTNLEGKQYASKV